MKKDSPKTKTQIYGIQTTKEQSDTSIISEQSLFNVNYYQKHIRILNQEIKFQKNAISTAEQLIQSYVQQNMRLNSQNQQFKLVINNLKNKLYNVESLLIKIMNNDRQTQNFIRSKSNQANDTLQDSIFSESLMKKLQNVLQKQQDYEDQILKLNKKIKKLQNYQTKNINPKTAIFRNLNSLQENMLSNHQLDAKIKYGAQKNKQKQFEKCISTARTIKHEQNTKKSRTTRIKTEIQKQFQVFVKNQKNTPKNIKTRSISESRSRVRLQKQIVKRL